MSTALTDIRVVDVSGTIATGYCAKLFADYGADVVNLEPPEGFPTRRIPPYLPDVDAPENAAMHAYLHTGKRSVTRDGLPATEIDALLRHADLVLDDGASPFDLAQVTGVRCTVSWYGLTGPYAGFAGTDAQCYALNGMMRIIGHPEGPPLIPTGYQAQFVAGVTAYIASLGQVFGRELGNCLSAVHIDTSIFEATMCFTDVGAISAHNTGLQADRMGVNRLPPTYPLGVFPCRDGWIGLTVLTPQQWHAFCALLDMAEYAEVPLFQSAGARGEAADVLEPVFTEKLLGFSAEELFYRGQDARIPLARVPTMEELFGVDQFVERRAFSDAVVPGGRVLTVPSVPFRLFSTPPAFGGSVAALGAHNGDFGS
ncbi:MAG: CaiB/BaiF CoA-transferase family protein [Pseudomonadales bacterium]|jgi:crotonobetainyl-CoA:carnitine CoA-transferase CaiB-like acyl-CoA transferase